MKKIKKLTKELEILALQREILTVIRDINELQEGTSERRVGFDTSSPIASELIGYAIPSEPDSNEGDEID